jgi:hypothetical protein
MVSRWFHSNPLSLQYRDIFLRDICCRYSMLNGIVDSRKVRAQNIVTSSQSSGGVPLSLVARKTDLRSKCLRRVCGGRTKKCGSGMKYRGSGTTSTLMSSLSSKLSFKLIDLTISFAIV